MTKDPNTQGDSEDPIDPPESPLVGRDLPFDGQEGWTGYDDPPLPDKFWETIDEGLDIEPNEAGSEWISPMAPVDGDVPCS
ncbi:MAG: hypothetical protein ACKO2G_10390 [Verrucomicrobiales bacterium]